MKGSKTSVTVALLMVFILSLLMLAGCENSESGDSAGGDVLSGTWEGTYEDGDAKWTFDGKGGCEVDNAFIKGHTGTYTIKGDTVEILLKGWDDALAYEFKIEGNTLTLTAPNPYNPNYSLTKK